MDKLPLYYHPDDPSLVLSTCRKCVPTLHDNGGIYRDAFVPLADFTVETFDDGTELYYCARCGQVTTAEEYTKVQESDIPTIDYELLNYPGGWPDNGGSCLTCPHCTHNRSSFRSSWNRWVCHKCGRTYSISAAILYEEEHRPHRSPIITDSWVEVNCPNCWRRGMVSPSEVNIFSADDGTLVYECGCGYTYTEHQLKHKYG